MSNEAPKFKTPRKMQEIQGEYTNQCTKAGDLAYKISAMQKDLTLVYDSIRDLNLEYVAAVQAESAKRAEDEAAAKAKAEQEAPAKPQEAPAPDNVTQLKKPEETSNA